MHDSTTKQARSEGLPEFGPDTIEGTMRARVRETIEAIVTEELEAALGASKSARVGDTRQGYRHGHRERTLTTSLGPATIAMPRARIQAADGTTAEWRSATVTRYQRRTGRERHRGGRQYRTGVRSDRVGSIPVPDWADYWLPVRSAFKVSRAASASVLTSASRSGGRAASFASSI